MRFLSDSIQTKSIFYISNILIFLLLMLMVYQKEMSIYGHNPSSLIKIHSELADLNKKYIAKNQILFTEGGYDGQFFYMISKYLYSPEITEKPIMDTYRLRFRRIGLPILSGYFSSITTFQFYPQITFSILILFHISSFILFSKTLGNHYYYLSLFYLYSPFSILSIYLLVSDSLLASLYVFLYYFFNLPSISKFNLKTKDNSAEISILVFFTSILFLLTKETGIIFLFSLLLVFFMKRKYNTILSSFFAILVYSVFITWIQNISLVSEGTQPLKFADLLDYPFLGFIRGIQYENFSSIRNLPKEVTKIILFSFFLSVLYVTKSWKRVGEAPFYLPILFLGFVGTFAVQGYWFSFDNSMRFFTLMIPHLILMKKELPYINLKIVFSLEIVILILLLGRVFLSKAREFQFFS